MQGSFSEANCLRPNHNPVVHIHITCALEDTWRELSGTFSTGTMKPAQMVSEEVRLDSIQPHVREEMKLQSKQQQEFLHSPTIRHETLRDSDTQVYAI